MQSIRIVVLIAAFAASVVPAQDRCGFKYDPSKRIIAYHLTHEQEEMFQTNDGNQISPFWYAWDVTPFFQAETLNCLQHYAYGPQDCRSNTSDAQITLRAAWGNKGVYLCFIVQDDHFMTPAPGQEHLGHFYDVVDVFIDQVSAHKLYLNPDHHFFNKTFSQLTPTCRNLKVPMGDYGILPENFYLLMPHAPVEMWRAGPMEWFRFETFTFSKAAKDFCIHIDIIKGPPGCRKQEWLIPWTAWGGGYSDTGPQTGYGSKPSEGTALAFTFGYNDMDPDLIGLSHTAIRWRNQKDPWFSHNECPESGQSVDAWGEILFDMSMNTVLRAVGAPDLTDETIGFYYNAQRVTAEEDHNQICDRDPAKVPQCKLIPVNAGAHRQHNRHVRTVASSEVPNWYSITGRRIGVSMHTAGVVIRNGSYGPERLLRTPGRAMESMIAR